MPTSNSTAKSLLLLTANNKRICLSIVILAAGGTRGQGGWDRPGVYRRHRRGMITSDVMQIGLWMCCVNIIWKWVFNYWHERDVVRRVDLLWITLSHADGVFDIYLYLLSSISTSKKAGFLLIFFKCISGNSKFF